MKLKNLYKEMISKYWGIIIFLISLVYIADQRFFTSPPLYSDDWSALINPYIFGDLQYADFNDRRPLINLVFSTLSPIFGLNIEYYYIVNFLIIFLTGVLLFLIIREAFPEYSWLALPVTLIFQIHPLDLSKQWLTLITNHFVLLLIFVVILLMIKYMKYGKMWTFLLAHVLFLFSLFMYEGGLGLIIAVSILLAFFYKKRTLKRSLFIFTFLITASLFLIWRLLIQPNYLNIQDPYLDTMSLDFFKLVYRYAYAGLLIIYTWIRPLTGFLGKNKFIFLAFMGIIFIVGCLIYIKISIKSAKSSTVFNWDDRKKTLIKFLLFVLIGLILWWAGYVPAISLITPDYHGNTTRNNSWSIAGASLATVSAVAALVTLKVSTNDSVKLITGLVIFPLILLGVIYQIWSQNERFTAWDVQKNIWNRTFDLVPGLKDDSKLGIILTGYEELGQFEILPFGWRWDVDRGVRVLYNNPNLSGFFYFIGRPEIVRNSMPVEKDWSDYVIIHYDSKKATTEIIERLEDFPPLKVEIIDYQPYERIVEKELGSSIYRFLVE